MVLVQICDTHVVTTAHMDMTDPIVFSSRSVTVEDRLYRHRAGNDGELGHLVEPHAVEPEGQVQEPDGDAVEDGEAKQRASIDGLWLEPSRPRGDPQGADGDEHVQRGEERDVSVPQRADQVLVDDDDRDGGRDAEGQRADRADLHRLVGRRHVADDGRDEAFARWYTVLPKGPAFGPKASA